ncbi:hypothetical protein [Bacillus massiliglaciei]|uniref:hypothetical protein n=1 Tax=Bacillus massiliglaciei TaxID=1816693 RepID=UPI000DA6380A|nr:hypothetical protein [Bacillus massiliglaciei]
MNMNTREDGKIVISGDEALLKKIEANPSLAGISVSDYRICADSLATLFLIAEARKDEPNIKRYALMKQKYLETFSK